MSIELKSIIKIFITGCLWGTIGLFVKLMEGEGSSASYTSFLRLFFGALLLAVMTLIFDGFRAFRIGRRTLLSCMLLGIVCQGTFNILYSMSVSMNGMSVGSVLLYTAPVFTGITSAIVFEERLNCIKLIALLVNVAGCVLTATGGNFSAASLVPLGLLFGLIATALAYGFYFSGLSKISQAGKVPVIASVEVVVATVIGALAFTERMTAVRVLGIALVLFSIVLFNMRKLKTIKKGRK